MLSFTAAALYSLLSLCVEAVLVWPYIQAMFVWFAAGWAANLVWWTLYLGLMVLLVD